MAPFHLTLKEGGKGRQFKYFLNFLKDPTCDVWERMEE